MIPSYDMELFKLKAELCKTFSDPKRLLIINELRGYERTVGDLARSLELNQSVVSRHLGILRSKGIVRPRSEGSSVFYRLTDPKIGEACDLVHQVLMSQMEKNKVLAEKFI
jgi:ArsR family transcriptional regulator